MGQEKMNHVIAPTPDQITLRNRHLERPTGCSSASPRGRQQFDNDRKGIARLIAWIAPLQPKRIICKATGAYHRALEMALGKAALPSVKINPLQMRRFAQATGTRAKTDPIDAGMLTPIRLCHAAGYPASQG